MIARRVFGLTSWCGPVSPLSRLCMVLALLACSNPSWAQWDNADPIDVRLNVALEKDLSDEQVFAAIAVAESAWDGRLNAAYRDLQQRLPSAAATQLKQAQRAWLRFRDAEYAGLDRLYEDSEESTFMPTKALDRLRLLRHRVLQLEAWQEAWNLRNQ